MEHIAIDRTDLDALLPALRHTDVLADPHETRTMHFGLFSLCPGARVLKRGSSAVPLGSRAFDLLVVLLRSRGQLVTKDEIVREVWPSTFVDESNVRFQMGVLRKALGPERGRIKTIPGRGYIFADDEDVAPAPAVSRLDTSVLAGSLILIVEPDAAERNALTLLLRALKIRVHGFRSLEDVAAFTVAPARLAAA